MGSDAIFLNFLKKLDSTGCSMWVLEGLDFYSDMIKSMCMCHILTPEC